MADAGVVSRRQFASRTAGVLLRIDEATRVLANRSQPLIYGTASWSTRLEDQATELNARRSRDLPG
jgi:hypothetical protein